MKSLKNKFFQLVFILLSVCTHAQVNLDSLWGVWIDDGEEDTTRLMAIYQFASDGYLKNQPDSALYFAQLMFDYAEKKGNQYYQAKSYSLSGRSQSEKANNLEAKKNWVQALKIYQNIGDKRGVSRSLWDLGLTHYYMGQYVAAVENYSKSLIILRELNDTTGISGLLTNIGLIYEAQEDYAKALEYYEQGARILEEAGSLNNVALNKIIDIYIIQGDHPKALKYLNERLKQIESGITGAYYDSTFQTCWVLNDIGDIYAVQGDHTQALDHYLKCQVLAEKVSQDNILADTERKIGLLYESMNKGDLAVEWCARALKRAKESNIKSLFRQRSACECLYKSYKLLGDNARALEYHELFYLLNDSLKLEETAKSLQKMEFTKQMFADSLQQEEDKLKIEMAHQVELGKKDRTKNILIISGLIILFIAGGLLNRMYFVRKTNARLKIEKDRAERSEQFKQQFLANMSHEIRTPMNTIMGMTDIILRRNPKKDQLTYLNAIKESSNSLLLIINDILDLSKIEAGKAEFEHIQFSLDHVLNNVKTIMGLRAEEKSLILKVEKSKDVPNLFFGDPNRLTQVLNNLVGNAIKFTEKGSVSIRVEPVDLTIDKHKMIRFTIEDTGIGIEPDKLDKIFWAFEQAYSDTLRKYGGTGLGLAISKELVELQGGQISVSSKKGKGSDFSFEIPMEIGETVLGKLEKPVQKDKKDISRKLKGTSILLVEDNEFNIMVAKEELEDAIPDVKVIVAKNGKEAIEMLEKIKIEIVLMDLQMPVLNGYEATTTIRNLNTEKAKVPIIAMTANVMKEEVEKCMSLGMNDYISKPFETIDLLMKIGQLTRNV